MGVLHFFLLCRRQSKRWPLSQCSSNWCNPRHRVPESTSRISKEIKKQEKIMLHTTAWAAWRHSVTVCVCVSCLPDSQWQNEEALHHTHSCRRADSSSFICMRNQMTSRYQKPLHLPSLNLQDWNLGKTCFFLFAYHILKRTKYMLILKVLLNATLKHTRRMSTLW